jgi:hypothetical protein
VGVFSTGYSMFLVIPKSMFKVHSY